MENGRAQRRKERRKRRQERGSQPRIETTIPQMAYELIESEVYLEDIPQPEEIEKPQLKKKRKNGNPFVRWVNTHVDNVRLGLGILIFIMCALLLNNNLNVKKAYIVSGRSFYSILQMGKMDGDLTKTAREFVITGNDKYKKSYDNHVLVREGKNEDRRGVQKSFEDRFNDIPKLVVGDTQKERLNVSLKESDILAEKEMEAIGIILEGGDKEAAIQLVFGEEYDKQKDKILTPLLEFTDDLQMSIGTTIVKKLYFSYGYIIILCLANLVLIFLINDRLDLSIRDEE